MKVLIFGSKGQLGSSILEKFAVNSSKNLSITAFSREDLDISDATQVEKIFETHRPDTVINCAAWTDVASAESNYSLARDVNYGGVVNIARESEKFDSRIIQISTDYVFRGSHKLPINELELQNPINRYGETKAEAEKFLLREYPESSVIVRTAWLYGPYGKNFARTIIRKALLSSQECIQVVEDQLGQPTSTLDLASRILEVVNSNVRCGVYHGTNSGSTSWFGFAQLLLDSAEIGSERIAPIKSLDYTSSVKRPKYSVLSHESWKSIGFSAMRSWDDSVKESALRIRKEVEKENGI
jgi:dTDP-4-dehydrorhamnose reductase